MSGWILSVRHRYVTDLIVSSDSVGNGHFSDYHRFFSRAVWDNDKQRNDSNLFLRQDRCRLFSLLPGSAVPGWPTEIP
ncbi:MAG: hypothetical protein R3E01_08950 [Pirellulaceae bacterium]